MSREVHVRFCEGPGVKLLRPTHPYIPMARGFVYLAVVLDWVLPKPRTTAVKTRRLSRAHTGS